MMSYADDDSDTDDDSDDDDDIDDDIEADDDIDADDDSDDDDDSDADDDSDVDDDADDGIDAHDDSDVDNGDVDNAVNSGTSPSSDTCQPLQWVACWEMSSCTCCQRPTSMWVSLTRGSSSPWISLPALSQVLDSGEEGGLARVGVATLTGILAFLVLEKVL